MEENEKKKASGKEVLMIIVVVVLAFGLTVAGIVYLTNFLIGNDTPQQAQQEPNTVVPQAPEAQGNVVVFSADNNTPAPEAPIIPPATTTDPVPPAPTAPITPAAPVTSVPTATPAPQVTKPVQGTPQNVPMASPTKGSYQLQLFAFRNQQKAISEAQKYISEFPDIYIMRADLGADGIWYRVRCCSSNSQDDLKIIKAELETKHKITPYIVRVQ